MDERVTAKKRKNERMARTGSLKSAARCNTYVRHTGARERLDSRITDINVVLLSLGSSTCEQAMRRAQTRSNRLFFKIRARARCLTSRVYERQLISISETTHQIATVLHYCWQVWFFRRTNVECSGSLLLITVIFVWQLKQDVFNDFWQCTTAHTFNCCKLYELDFELLLHSPYLPVMVLNDFFPNSKNDSMERNFRNFQHQSHQCRKWLYLNELSHKHCNNKNICLFFSGWNLIFLMRKDNRSQIGNYK